MLAACLLTTFAQAQNIPYPSNISPRGSFSNPVGASAGSAYLIDNDLGDGYAAGADTFGTPEPLLLGNAPGGSAFLQSGTPASGGAHTSALWFQSYYSTNVGPEITFNVGYLYFRNGSSAAGTGLTGFDLNFALGRPPNISLPNNLNPTLVDYAAGLIDTPDTGSAAQNADSIVLEETLFLTNFKDDNGNPYYFKIGFADPTSGGSVQSPTVFSVTEGSVTRTTITGVFTTVPEPSAAALGELGSLVLLRRRRQR